MIRKPFLLMGRSAHPKLASGGEGTNLNLAPADGCRSLQPPLFPAPSTLPSFLCLFRAHPPLQPFISLPPPSL